MANDDPNLSQEAIDALINQVAGNASVSPSGIGSKAGKTVGAKSDAALSQGDIDAMIGEVQQHAQQRGAAAPTAAAKPLTGAVSAPAKAGVGTASAQPTTSSLGQDDIDRLLAELGGGNAPSQKPGTGSSTKAPPGSASHTAQSVPTTSVADAARSNQPGTTSSQAASRTDANTNANAATLTLSPDDLDALVARQVGFTSDHGEAPMIDQGDIDALVKQLANATSAPDTKHISDALAKHEGEIDKLLATSADPKITLDAVDIGQIVGKTRTTSVVTAAGIAVPVMAPSELKGTRWLLMAAVLLLATCAGSLALVMGAINGLAHELKSHHQAQLTPSDSFGDDLKAAQAKLADPDEVEVAKSELFMQRLKQRHPSHEAEIALVLAHHFRARGAFRQAAEEYALLADGANGPSDDPRLHLDYAEMLAAQHDAASAIKQVYLVLANEALYLGDHDHRGVARPADELARNHQTMQDAYLALGRLLNNTPHPTQVAQLGHVAAPPAVVDGHAAGGHADSGHAAPPAADAHATEPAAASNLGHGAHP